MKTLDTYIKKLSAAERTAIAEGTRQKISAIHLQRVREAAGLTQEQVAQRMGVTQASLSRMEHRPDVKLSNIRKYIEAIGGRLEVSVLLPASRNRHVRTARRAPSQRIELVTA